ncbi:MAG: dihydroorotate dehydrogenase electron transfer subunit [Desulfobacteraceae bacterium]|nr:dihydroorotate dehydrogenase electron transfer subunit [Desulfobacteraceae bacterium]
MQQLDAPITRREQLAPDLVRLTLLAPAIAAGARPGQFLTIKSGPGHDPLLRRPFSIHRVVADGSLQVLFKVLGPGTRSLARLKVGESVNLVGPLGNYFQRFPAMCLVGGGLGIAPLLFLAQEIRDQAPETRIELLLGARNRQELAPLAADFADLGLTPRLATDDGSWGHHGLVTDLIPQALGAERDWRIGCCGPYPMMRAVAALCQERGWGCQVSLETMMACGIKACLGCAVAPSPRRETGGRYLHVCQDGPVFNSEDLAWTP